MPTRRDLLLMGAMLTVTKAPAWGLNLDNALLRYRNWLAQFQFDLEQLSAHTGKSGVSDDRVGTICDRSIVPHSRAALMVSGWLIEAADHPSTRRNAERYADLGSVTMLLLEHSVPAGHGGLFREAPVSRFSLGRFSVWYMHMGGPGALQAYFDDKTQFPHYKLPPNGTLKRHSYPFLLFEDEKNTLRLAGIGAEWMGAAVYLHRKQYS